MASPTKDLAIPLIDIGPLSSSSASERKACADAILNAFETSGFLYLSSSPIAPSTVQAVFTASAAFFARPQVEKDQLAWTTPRSNRGYVAPGREKVSDGLTTDEVAVDRAAAPDLKESIEIGRDNEPGHPNRWPESDELGVQFRNTMTGFFGECKSVHSLLMDAIGVALGLPRGFFKDYVQAGDNNLRLLHYPPVKREVFQRNKDQVRAGAHTDYGSITLLFQDDRGGLQVQDSNGGWKDVTPIPGTIVVNAGDLLARWSNDHIRSTRHRVVEPPLMGKENTAQELQVHPARYSVAYFCNPDYNRMIEALPGTWNKPEEKKYGPVNSGDYLFQRLAATY